MRKFVLESNYFSKEDKLHLLKEYEKEEVKISSTPPHLVHEILQNQDKFWMKANPNGIASALGNKLEPIIEFIFGWFKDDADGWDFIAKINSILLGLKKGDRIELKGFNTFTESKVLSLDKKKKWDNKNDRWKFEHLAVCYVGDHKIRFALIPQHRIEKRSHSINFNPGLKHNHSKPIFSKMTLLFQEFEIENFNDDFKKALEL
jgi:hypothetical protein